MSLTLISATPSPYARKVRITLAEKGIPFNLHTEVPWDSTTTVPQYNPLEKLPILLVPKEGIPSLSLPPTPTAISVFESKFILEWLEAKFPAPAYKPMLPRHNTDEQLRAREIEVVADGMCDATVLRFFEIQRAHPSEEWMARQRRKLDGGVKWLAGKVKGEREFLVGGEFGLADVAVGTVCGYLDVRFREYGWREAEPRLARYVDWVSERKSFRDTVPVPQDIKDKIV